jgi:hypothetical protein
MHSQRCIEAFRCDCFKQRRSSDAVRKGLLATPVGLAGKSADIDACEDLLGDAAEDITQAQNQRYGILSEMYTLHLMQH